MAPWQTQDSICSSVCHDRRSIALHGLASPAKPEHLMCLCTSRSSQVSASPACQNTSVHDGIHHTHVCVQRGLCSSLGLLRQSKLRSLSNGMKAQPLSGPALLHLPRI